MATEQLATEQAMVLAMEHTVLTVAVFSHQFDQLAPSEELLLNRPPPPILLQLVLGSYHPLVLLVMDMALKGPMEPKEPMEHSKVIMALKVPTAHKVLMEEPKEHMEHKGHMVVLKEHMGHKEHTALRERMEPKATERKEVMELREATPPDTPAQLQPPPLMPPAQPPLLLLSVVTELPEPPAMVSEESLLLATARPQPPRPNKIDLSRNRIPQLIPKKSTITRCAFM